MSTIAVGSPAAVRAPAPSALRALAAVEARRFARHPLFLVSTALTAWFAYDFHANAYTTRSPSAMEYAITPAFLVGLGGMIVAYRLTRSTRRADEAVAGVPADEPTRTAALLIACLVPFSVAILAVVPVIVHMNVEPMTFVIGWDYFSAAERDAMMAEALLAGLGGPVLGVCLGRWWRWTGAPLLATVVLVAWSVLSMVPWESRLGNLWHMSSPFTLWLVAEQSSSTRNAMGGSPAWRLGYLLALIGLAAVTAMLHGSSGGSRRTLRRGFVGLAIAVVATWLIASFVGPTMTTV